MTKLIVLSLTAAAAVSTPGRQRLLLTGFSPVSARVDAVNDNGAIVRQATWFRVQL